MDSNNTNNFGTDIPMDENVPRTEQITPEQAATPEQATVVEQTEVQPQPMPQAQSVPQAQPPKKKGKGGLIAVIIVAVVLVIALLIGGGLIAFGMLGSPESKITKGFANMAEEMESYQNPVMEKVQMDDILQKMNENGSYIDTSMNITQAELMASLGIDLTANVNKKDKLVNMEMGMSVMNIAIATLQMSADEDNMYLAVPELFEDTLVFPVEDFAQKFNDSQLAYYANTQLPEDYELDIFPDEEAVEETEVDEEYWKEFFGEKIAEDQAAIAESLQVEKYDETKELTINGKDVKCKGYLVTAGQDAINQFFTDLVDELVNGKFGEEVVKGVWKELVASGYTEQELADYGYTEESLRDEWELMMEDVSFEVQDDFEMIVYMDSKNRIVSIELNEVEMLIADQELNVQGEVNFLGAERTLDEIEGEMIVGDGMTDITFALQRSAEVSKEEMNDSWTVEIIGDADEEDYIKMQFTNNWNVEDMEYYIDAYVQSDVDMSEIELEVAGSIPEYEAGSSCTFEIEDATIYFDLEPVIMVSGYFTMGELQEEIEMPSDAWDILSADDSELESFFMEIYENMTSLMEDFGGMSY